MLDPIEAWCDGLIGQLDTSARRQLAREVARKLRENQSSRIAQQQNPDGSAFAPRKPQLKNKKGRIRRGMFSKMRTAKYLKADATPDAATVRFAREVERMARVHHFGLRDKVNRKTGLEVDYPARQLLGLTVSDEAAIMEITLAHLKNGL